MLEGAKFSDDLIDVTENVRIKRVGEKEDVIIILVLLDHFCHLL